MCPGAGGGRAAWLLGLFAAVVGLLSFGVWVGLASAATAAEGPEPVPLVSDALIPPVDGGAAPKAVEPLAPLAHTATSGPGAYNVIVVAVKNDGLASPATTDNTPAEIVKINKLWVDASAGMYTLNYNSNGFVSATYPGNVCTLGNPLDAMDTLFDSSVRTAVTAAGYSGTKNLVLYVLPSNQGCPAGLAWVGWSSNLNGGFWPTSPLNANPHNGPEITAHEMGHNFGAGHAGTMACAGSSPLYPGAQAPTWPCGADSSNEYSDYGSMMGQSGTGIVPKRLSFNQLQRLSLSSAANARAVTTGTFDLKPSGAKATADSQLTALELAVPNTTTPIPPTPVLTSAPKVILEFRQVAGSPAGVFLEQAFDRVAYAFAPGDSASVWSYPGNAANQSTAAFGMTAGTTIKLADNRVVKVESITPGNARVSITAIGPPTITAANPLDSSAQIVFTAPAVVPGVTVTNYEYSIDDGATWTPRVPTVTTSPLTIDGLRNGTTYRVKLRAITNLGEGQASATAQVTPRTIPSAPIAPVGTGEDGRATIAFTPGYNGGAAVTEFQYSLDGKTWAPVAKPTNPDGSPISNFPNDTTSPVAVWGLSNNATYQVWLRAVNPAGAGPAS
ncbi:MAG: fibronectin type III domain-containing protein, partial [Candidatus Nanopelagicales bacterium]